VVVEGPDVAGGPAPSQEPVRDGMSTEQKELGRSSLVRDRGNWRQGMRRNRNLSERALGALAGGYAEKSCLRDASEAGMGVSLGNNFARMAGHSLGRNGEGKEQEPARAHIQRHLLDGRTYRRPHTDKPGSIGKESCEQFPGEGGDQYLGLPREMDDSTAWRRQGKAAEGRDSNKRPVVGSMPWAARSLPRASTLALAQLGGPALVFRTRGLVWRCSTIPGSQDPWSDRLTECCDCRCGLDQRL